MNSIHAKFQSEHHYQNTNIQFLQARCPSSCQSTDGSQCFVTVDNATHNLMAARPLLCNSAVEILQFWAIYVTGMCTLHRHR